MRESIWKKGVVMGIVFVFLGASTALGMNTVAPSLEFPGIMSHEVQAVEKDIGRQPSLMGNVRVSPGVWNDSYPRMTTNAAGDIIIVYEQEETEDDIPLKTVPVVYSADEGDTWTQQFVFNSVDFYGSGFFSDPDISYNPAQDILWVNTVDRLTQNYPDIMYFIQGDIAHATEAIGYAIGWTSSTNCFEVACTHSNDYYLNFITIDYPGYDMIPGFGWFCYPDYSCPPALGGFYFDGQSKIRTAPVKELEADYNINRWFFVAESEAIEGGTQIVIKSGTTDKALIDSGEQQNGMDKYGDLEQAPGEFLGLGTDPDVSGSGNMVAVVFIRDGTILCSVSSCVATYEPEFSWQTYTVDDTGGASTPAVYMQGNDIYVAYVRDGNLYYRVSPDFGVTWGESLQKNDVNGTVVTEKGSVDVCKLGIAFVDNRNGNLDVYFAEAKGAPAPELTITSLGPLIMTIKNIGDAPAYNISWNIKPTVKEGFIFPGKSLSGTVLGFLEPDQEITVGQKQFLLGFGSIEIVGTAWADNAPLVLEKRTGRLLLFFYIPE